MCPTRSGFTPDTTLGKHRPKLVVLPADLKITKSTFVANDNAKVCEFGYQKNDGTVNPITANTDTAKGVHVFYMNDAADGEKAHVLTITDAVKFEMEMSDICYQNAIGTRCNVAVTSNCAYLIANTGGAFEVVSVDPVMYPFETNARANGLVTVKVVPAFIQIAPA